MTKNFFKIEKELLDVSVNSTDAALQNGETFFFSKQETDILFHLVRGKTAKEIGKFLGLSHRTIEHRIEKIKIKAGASSKSELIEKIFDKFK